MIKKLLQEFIGFVQSQASLELYNEAGLQHELAIFLRSKLETNYRVQLERHVEDVTNIVENFKKKEMDVYIENISDPTEQYCIELKVS